MEHSEKMTFEHGERLAKIEVLLTSTDKKLDEVLKSICRDIEDLHKEKERILADSEKKHIELEERIKKETNLFFSLEINKLSSKLDRLIELKDDDAKKIIDLEKRLEALENAPAKSAKEREKEILKYLGFTVGGAVLMFLLKTLLPALF